MCTSEMCPQGYRDIDRMDDDDEEEEEEEEKHISLYRQHSTGSGARGWVTHLLHHLVEEGAKVESVSTKNALSFCF